MATASSATTKERLYLFDTTLRDGAQTNGVDFTLHDKLAIAAMIDELGIDYIEKRNAIVDAVTLEDTKRVAKRIWGQGLLSVSVGRAAQAATEPATITAPKAN